MNKSKMATTWTSEALQQIALEGLDGITLSTLLLRLAEVGCGKLISDPEMVARAKESLWDLIKHQNHFDSRTKTWDYSFYILEKERIDVQIYDRFAYRDQVNGAINEPAKLPRDPYLPVRVNPNNKFSKNHGSCHDAETRKNVTDDVIQSDITWVEANERWGQERIAIVASQNLRHIALTGSPHFKFESELLYCMLELIGRSRRRGIASSGQESAEMFKGLTKQHSNLHFVTLLEIGLIKRHSIIISPHSGAHVNGFVYYLARYFKDYDPPYVHVQKYIVKLLQDAPNNELLSTHVIQKVGVSNHLLQKAIRESEGILYRGRKLNPSIKRELKIITLPERAHEYQPWIDDDKDEEKSDSDDDQAFVPCKVERDDLEIVETLTKDPVFVNKYSRNIGESFTVHILKAMATKVQELNRGLTISEIGKLVGLTRKLTRRLITFMDRKDFFTVSYMNVANTRAHIYSPKHLTSLQSVNEREFNRIPAKRMRRMRLIERYIHQRKIVTSLLEIRTFLSFAETGSEDHKIDLKLIDGILDKMATFGMINYETQRVQSNNTDRNNFPRYIRLIWSKEIDRLHPAVEARYQQLLAAARHESGLRSYFVLDENEPANSTLSAQNAEALKKEIRLYDDQGRMMINPSYILRFMNEKPKFDLKAPRQQGIQPHVVRATEMYKFLFYLLYDGYQTAVKHGVKYTDWRSQITPIPPDKSDWAELWDITEQLPVYFFYRIIFFPYRMPELNSLLEDETRRYTPFGSLAPTLRATMSYKNTLFRKLFELTQVLCTLRLINIRQDISQRYVLKRIQLIREFSLYNPTSGEVEHFTLNKLEDVDLMFTALYRHCVSGDCAGSENGDENCTLPASLRLHSMSKWVRKGIAGSISTIRKRFPKGQSVESRIDKPRVKRKKPNEDEDVKQEGEIVKKPTKVRAPKEPVAKKIKTPKVTVPKKIDPKARLDSIIPKLKPFRRLAKRNMVPLNRKLARQSYPYRAPRSRCSAREDDLLLHCHLTSIMLQPTCRYYFGISSGDLHRILKEKFVESRQHKNGMPLMRRIHTLMRYDSSKKWIGNCITNLAFYPDAVRITQMNVDENYGISQADLLEKFKALLEVVLKFTHDLTLRRLDHVTIEGGLDNVAEVVEKYEIRDANVLLDAPKFNKYDLGLDHDLTTEKIDLWKYCMILGGVPFRLYDMENAYKVLERCQIAYRSILRDCTEKTLAMTVCYLRKRHVITGYKTSKQTDIYRELISPLGYERAFLHRDLILGLDATPLNVNTFYSPLTSESIQPGCRISNLFADYKWRLAAESASLHDLLRLGLVQSNLRGFKMNRKSLPQLSDQSDEVQFFHRFNRFTPYSLSFIHLPVDISETYLLNDTDAILDDYMAKVTRTFEEEYFELDNCLRHRKGTTSTLSRGTQSLEQFIFSNGDLGVTSEDIKSLYANGNWPANSLRKLLKSELIFQVGVTEERWVARSHAACWAVKFITEFETVIRWNYFFPAYWRLPDGQLNKSCIIEFLAAIVGHVVVGTIVDYESVLASINVLDRTHLSELVNFLAAMKIVTCEEHATCGLNDNPFVSPDRGSNARKRTIFLKPTHDSFLRMCRLKALILGADPDPNDIILRYSTV